MWGSGKTAQIKNALIGTTFTEPSKPTEFVVVAGVKTDVKTNGVETKQTNLDAPTTHSESSLSGLMETHNSGHHLQEVGHDVKVARIATVGQSRDVTKVVLDSGAFISGAKLDAFGPDCEYVTIEDVVRELRDEQSRQRFNNFPYPIRTRMVSTEAMEFVTTAARRTGDLAALSLTDRKVLALAIMVEKETHGTENLLMPSAAASATFTAASPFATSSTSISSTLSSTAKPTIPSNGTVDVSSSPSSLDSPFAPFAETETVNPFSLSLFLQGTAPDCTFVPFFNLPSLSLRFPSLTIIIIYDQFQGVFLTCLSIHFPYYVDHLVWASTGVPLNAEGLPKEHEDSDIVVIEDMDVEDEDDSDDAKDENNAEGHDHSDEQDEQEQGKDADDSNEWTTVKRNRVWQKKNRAPRGMPGFDDGEWITPESIHTLGISSAPEVVTVSTAKTKTDTVDAKDNNDSDSAAGTKASSVGENEETKETQSPARMNIVTTPQSPLRLLHSKSSVAVITTDFAMQNVLLQTGLRVVAAQTGKAVTSIRHWMFRCTACLTLTREYIRGFCPKCGNYTLVRVSVEVDAKGRARYHWSWKKVTSGRGTIYSIPKMKGGRNRDLILRDMGKGGHQVSFLCLLSPLSYLHLSPIPIGLTQVLSLFSLTFLPRLSLFSLHSYFLQGPRKQGDAYEEALEFELRRTKKESKGMVVGYGRRNPNVARPTGNKKKKNHR